MKEIVIVSGKGGTGKTSITASFAALFKNATLADCDVDAADLHLILNPKVIIEHDFLSGHTAIINKEKCTGCGKCYRVCNFDAIKMVGDIYEVNPVSCEGCSVCVKFCPQDAIDFPEADCGKWYISDTRFGTMVHARLNIAAENSGKLVSMVRSNANKIAKENSSDIILIDGPPGTGCPVIASITGTDIVVVVTEPTLSGKHDLERVAKLASHFKIPIYLIINKWDINGEITKEIEEEAEAHNINLLGRVSYDKCFTDAQIVQKSVVEFSDNKVSDEIKAVWERLCKHL